jgi:DNA-binding LacI/PurR family transcriptional regulator
MSDESRIDQSDIPFYKQLRNVLLERIESGEFESDRPIPSEQALCKRYGVSRTTVRQALSELTNSGHLLRIRGKGTFVTPANEPSEPKPTRIIAYLPNGSAKTGFRAPMINGIEECAYKRGYNVLVGNSEEKIWKAEAYIREFVEKRVDGIIFIPLSSTNHSEYLQDNLQVLSIARKASVPVVLTDRYIRGVDLSYVICDFEQGFYNLTKHMIGLGHRRIGVIANPYSSSVADRLIGYRRALAEHGIEYNEDLIIQLKESGEDHNSREATHELLRRGDRPTCILGTWDGIARGIYFALEEQGIAVPEQIAIAGFDNRDFAEHFKLPLTTVSYSLFDMGQRACSIVLDRIEGKGEELVQIKMKTELIVRQSCGFGMRSDRKDKVAVDEEVE